MLISIFKSKNPIVYGVLFLITVLLWVPEILAENTINMSAKTAPLERIYDAFTFSNKIVQSLISILLVFGTGVFINRMFEEHKLIQRNSFYPALFWIIISSTPNGVYQISNVYLGLFLFLIAVDRLFGVSRSSKVKTILFDASFIASASVLVNYTNLVFLPFPFLILLFLRAFNPKEWLVMILGVAAPFTLLWLYFFLFNSSDQPFNDFTLLANESEKVMFKNKVSFSVFIATIVGLLIVTIPQLIKSLVSNIVNVRNLILLVLFFGGFALLSLFLYQGFSPALAVFLAVPIAYVFALYFSINENNFFNELILIAFILAAIYHKVQPLMYQ